MTTSNTSNFEFNWLPATLEQLNLFYDKSPIVTNICVLMICAAPLALVIFPTLYLKRKTQDSDVLKAYIQIDKRV